MVNSQRLLKMFMFRLAFGLASLFTLLMPVGHANEICPAPSEYRDCFALDLDWPAVAERKPELAGNLKKVHEGFKRSTEPAQSARVVADTLLDIQKRLKADQSNVEPEAFNTFLTALTEAIIWFRAVASGIPTTSENAVLIDNFKLNTGDAGRTPKEWLMRQQCWVVTEKDGASKCASEYVKARTFGESVAFVNQIVDKYYASATRPEAFEINKSREAQWNSYLYATQF